MGRRLVFFRCLGSCSKRLCCCFIFQNSSSSTCNSRSSITFHRSRYSSGRFLYKEKCKESKGNNHFGKHFEVVRERMDQSTENRNYEDVLIKGGIGTQNILAMWRFWASRIFRCKNGDKSHLNQH